MIMASVAVITGLFLLVWSADRFVVGASAVARHFGMPLLLIGMVILGFGTSAPEMVVSALAALQGNPGIALGNAYGSNIANIGLILGTTALIKPITVHANVLKKELPMLCLVTLFSCLLLWDQDVSRPDAVLLLLVFSLIMAWTLRQAWHTPETPQLHEIEVDIDAMPLKTAGIQLSIGLIVLIVSSRSLVWGAVDIARYLGVSDVIIGLTIVSIGTSLPELASSITAARKGQHDMALGNVLGSNLFNTLAVVGIAGAIKPFAASPEIVTRDMPVMGCLTLSIFAIGYGFFDRQGRINRLEGGGLLIVYCMYTTYLVATIVRL